MHFNKHWELNGKHSVLSASSNAWSNYDEAKFKEVYKSQIAKLRGTRLHALAKEAIELKVHLPRSHRTLDMYVNDAIGFGLTPEQPLAYSKRAFCTADTIGMPKNILRVHDLKTGSIPAKMRQLEIEAAYFCLEYDIRPDEIPMELRIYQNDDIVVMEPDPAFVSEIMKKIVLFDALMEEMENDASV